MGESLPTVTAIGKPRVRAALPAPGTRIGRFVVVDRLGAGAMGTVFLASDAELGRHVAIKLLSTHDRDDDRLLDEARALAKLQHPNVVAVHDVGRWDGRVYLAMEYIAGPSLDLWLEGHPDWRERLTAYRQVAAGLAAAHAVDIVHHDVKPSNVVAGNDGRVRLVDFGLARSVGPESASETGSGAGTPRYMAPEQRRGAVPDARSDQFSLCVAVYEALFAAYPFEGDTAEERDASVLAGRLRTPSSRAVPPSIRLAVLKGLAHDPADRHPTMAAFLAATEPAAPRHPTKLAAVAVASIALIGGAAYVATSADPAAPVERAGKYDLILTTSHLPPVVPTAAPDDPFGVTVHRLSNGLTVIFSPSHDIPRIRAVMRINAGDGDAPGIGWLAAASLHRGSEKIGTTDFAAERPLLDQIRAAYLERAAASDPAARAAIDRRIDDLDSRASKLQIPDEHDHVLRDLGRQQNAARTGHDVTTFTTDIPSNRFDAWAELEGDRFAHPVLRMFRSLVGEMAYFDADSDTDYTAKLAEMAMAEVFHGEGYGFTPARQRAAIAAEPYVETERFVRHYYVPNNAELVLAGDLDPATALPVLERAFAAWKPRFLPGKPDADVHPLDPATIQVPTTGNRAVAYVAGVSAAVADDPALETMRFLLVDALVRRHLVAELTEAPGCYVVTTSVSPKQRVDDVARALDEAIADVVDGKFSDEMLRAAPLHELTHTAIIAAHNDDRATSIVSHTSGLYAATWPQVLAAREASRHVRRADVLRVASRLLTAGHRLRLEPGPVPARPPHAAPKLVTTHYASGPSAAAKALVERDVVPVQPRVLTAGVDYVERDTPAGHFVTKLDPKASTFQLDMRWDLGADAVKLICASLLARGLELGGVGAKAGFINTDWSCGSRHVTIRLEGPDAELPAAIALVLDLFAPAKPTAWKEATRTIETTVADSVRTAGWVEDLAEEVALFGGSSFGRYDLAELHAATAADGARAGRTMLRAKRWIGYTGPRALADVIGLFPARPAGAPPAAVKKTLPPRSTGVYLIDAHELVDAARISIVYGLPQIGSGVPKARSELLIWLFQNDPTSVLDSQRGTSLFDVVRGSQQNARDPSEMAFRTRTTPANAPTAIRQTLHEVFDRPLDPALVQRARASGDEYIRTDWVKKSDVVHEVLTARMAGLTGSPDAEYRDQWLHLGPRDAQSFIDELRHAPRAIVIWGNLAGIDRDALRAYGKLHEWSLADLADAHRRHPRPGQ